MGALDRIPELACPACKGTLTETPDALSCAACARRYEIRDGIPRMIAEEMADLAKEVAVQDRVASDYEQRRYRDPYARKYHAWWTDQMLARVRTGGRILDNGCGIGLLFESLPPERVVGLDLSSEMLRRAAKHSDQLILGNSQDLPLKDASFDDVVCRSLLHHLSDPEAAVREMHRVLRPGGVMVSVDTNASLLTALPRRLAGRGPHFSTGHRNLDRNTLERLLAPFFTVDDVMYFGYIAYPLLGFPDLVRVFKYIPLKSLVAPTLMFIDNVLSHIPLVRTLGWGILVKGTRRDDRG
jgi:ubiquinone/menaquinone biosynthesis C-methylase UbiE